jgi:hypothetical protein
MMRTVSMDSSHFTIGPSPPAWCTIRRSLRQPYCFGRCISPR